MSYGSSMTVGRPVTTQSTSSLNLRAAAPKVVYPSSRQVAPQRCCETGRPVMMDPVTGGTICSCQLKSGIPAYLSRVPSLPETIYSAACHQFQHSTATPESPTAFYQVGMKPERAADGLKLAPSGVHAPYYLEHLMASHPYNAFYSGFDLNSARRKNATRETTSALKAWLYEHRKNPYPTKGEKIMLAIITRMTLTQVSTWFANARRRLKKESKLDDKDIDLDDIDVDDTSDNCTNARLSESDDGGSGNITADLSDISDVEESSPPSFTPQTCPQRLFPPVQRTETAAEKTISDIDLTRSNGRHFENSYAGKSSPINSKTGNDLHPRGVGTCDSLKGNVEVIKPKIWSISEIINSKDDKKKEK